MSADEKILAWAREGNELAIPLYVDQVLQYLRDSLRFFERDEADVLLTNSMINN